MNLAPSPQIEKPCRAIAPESLGFQFRQVRHDGSGKSDGIARDSERPIDNALRYVLPCFEQVQDVHGFAFFVVHVLAGHSGNSKVLAAAILVA